MSEVNPIVGTNKFTRAMSMGFLGVFLTTAAGVFYPPAVPVAIAATMGGIRAILKDEDPLVGMAKAAKGSLKGAVTTGVALEVDTFAASISDSSS